jgi:SAM-dependent methyltransferase
MTEKVFEGDPMIPAIERVIETLGSTTAQAALTEINSENDPSNRPPMESMRPEWLKRIVDAEYRRLPLATKSYGYHGTDADYIFGTKRVTSLVADYRQEQHNGGPLRILDVGTGAGGFLTLNRWPSGDVVHGISGFDYRTNPGVGVLTDMVRLCMPSEDDSRYLIGNAEYLDEIEGVLPEYDVIVTKMALQHLVDTLGSLEAIANRVVPGGMFCMHAGYRSQERALSLLLENGFSHLDAADVPANRADGGTVLIRTDDRPVRFGLGYAYEQKDPEFVAELERYSQWPLTQHDINMESWRYVGLAKPLSLA